MTINGVVEEKDQSYIIAQEYNLAYQPGEPLLTVEEVADYLQLQPETIRSMARRGELPGIKLGKVWRFNRIAIQDLFTA